MKVQYFRIGNIVNYFHHETCLNGIVTSINKKSITVNNHATIKIKSNNISPIPLTEEWLLRFGIEKMHDGNYWNKKLCIRKDRNEFYALYEQGRIYIQHVHQLQNLYFALTGEELTYEREKQ